MDFMDLPRTASDSMDHIWLLDCCNCIYSKFTSSHCLLREKVIPKTNWDLRNYQFRPFLHYHRHSNWITEIKKSVDMTDFLLFTLSQLYKFQSDIPRNRFPVLSNLDHGL